MHNRNNTMVISPFSGANYPRQIKGLSNFLFKQRLERIYQGPILLRSSLFLYKNREYHMVVYLYRDTFIDSQRCPPLTLRDVHFSIYLKPTNGLQ